MKFQYVLHNIHNIAMQVFKYFYFTISSILNFITYFNRNRILSKAKNLYSIYSNTFRYLCKFIEENPSEILHPRTENWKGDRERLDHPACADDRHSFHLFVFLSSSLPSRFCHALIRMYIYHFSLSYEFLSLPVCITFFLELLLHRRIAGRLSCRYKSPRKPVPNSLSAQRHLRRL